MLKSFLRFSILLCLAAPAARADALSTITIMAIDPAASEAGPKAATLYVARNDGDLSKPLTVGLQISGTATPGADYVPIASPIRFEPNVPLVTLRVVPVKDAIK